MRLTSIQDLYKQERIYIASAGNRGGGAAMQRPSRPAEGGSNPSSSAQGRASAAQSDAGLKLQSAIFNGAVGRPQSSGGTRGKGLDQPCLAVIFLQQGPWAHRSAILAAPKSLRAGQKAKVA